MNERQNGRRLSADGFYFDEVCDLLFQHYGNVAFVVALYSEFLLDVLNLVEANTFSGISVIMFFKMPVKKIASTLSILGRVLWKGNGDRERRCH